MPSSQRCCFEKKRKQDKNATVQPEKRGNPKQKWTSEEEEALRAGVAKHGVGKWKNIQKDPEFNHLLFARSNIDLKDKWRNLSVANGQAPRDKSKTPKGKANPAEAPSTSVPIAPSSASVTPLPQDASADVVIVDSSRSIPDGNNAAKYNAMIYEALSTLKEPNGSDSSAIANFIELRHQVPQNFKRVLSSRLRRLVQQDKLEKIQNRYKTKKDTPTDSGTLANKQQKEQEFTPGQSIGGLEETVEEAVISAAYRIAEAENKSFVAAQTVFEAERIFTVAEEVESLLQFARDCFDQCESGEILLSA